MRNESRFSRDRAIADQRAALNISLEKLKNKLLKSDEFLKICAVCLVIDKSGTKNLGVMLRQLFLNSPFPLTEEQAEKIVSEILREV